MGQVLELAAKYADFYGNSFNTASRAVEGMPSYLYNNLEAWLEKCGVDSAFCALVYSMPSPAYVRDSLTYIKQYVG